MSELIENLPDAALALALTDATARMTEGTTAGSGLLFVDATGARLDRLAELATWFAPGLEVLRLPAWDSLPYDRTPPCPAVIGRRVQALARLAEKAQGTRLVLTTARALLQRVPAPTYWASAQMTLAAGDEIDTEALRTRLASFGYHVDELVDQPGEVAFRGPVIDVFPGDADVPVRLTLEAGRVATMQCFDPLTQRTTTQVDQLVLRPVVEAEPDPEAVAAAAERMAHPEDAHDGGDEPGDADLDEAAPLVVDPAHLQASVFDYLGGMRAVVHPDAAERLVAIEEEVVGAYEAALTAARVEGRAASLPKPKLLYVAARTVAGRLAKLASGPEPAEAKPVAAARDMAALVADMRDAGGAVVVCGAEPKTLSAALARRGIKARVAANWAEACAGAPACVGLEIAHGFTRGDLTVLAAPPARSKAVGTAALPLEEPPRLSDIVVHEAHGVCRMTGLRRVGEEERLALAFHEGTELLVPTGELAQLWRYGSEAGHVALDRLHGEAWHKRRTEIEAEVTKTARALAAAAAARGGTRAPAIKAGCPGYRRVVERFAYPPSPDQAAAIEAVLADLAAGRPMDRLVCGDVGFGKTEVALRAAAAVALAGHQVAIIAPTTVLARQHLDTFRRRMAGTGVRVEPMLRGAAGPAAAEVRAGLADGSIGVVVGTQAIASDKVRFKRLGLVVIDEEQRFGDADKRKLTTLRNDGSGVHTMVMSATPIPRTLQAAMVGLRDISVIATPPVRRQPTRTFVLPFGAGIVREALQRERARGGQSFVVAPRIEDLGPLEEKLRAWVPGLSIAAAHGRLKPERLEELVAGFARGETDVLLATNIIEAGLDIPRANTILITGPQRFGLAQLHQMRGRVGRGARRGLAYVLTDEGAALAGPTARRLRTLETIEGLGAGVGIAAADMDARGAGDLFGNQQAGHVHAIGTELYQHILARELAQLDGRGTDPVRPVLRLEVSGRIPEEYVPESNLRLELYRRLARVTTADAVEDLAEELEDRFGAVPPALSVLLDEARLRAWCMAHGATRVDAGPKGVAFTVADSSTLKIPGAERKGERWVLPLVARDAGERLTRLLHEVRRDTPL